MITLKGDLVIEIDAARETERIGEKYATLIEDKSPEKIEALKVLQNKEIEGVKKIDGLRLTIRPEETNDVLFGITIAEAEERRLRETSPEYVMTDTIKFHIAIGYTIMSRITAWEGPEVDGKPAPCTMTTKKALFGQIQGLEALIAALIGRQEENETKNSEAS